MEYIMSMLSGIFAPVVAMSASPFITLTVLSGVGIALNNGWIPTYDIVISHELMALPIATPTFFFIILFITVLKYGMELTHITRAICEVTLGKIEGYIGQIAVVIISFLATTVTTTYITEYTEYIPSRNPFYVYIIAFISSAIFWLFYTVLRTVIKALDSIYITISFLPIPFLSLIISNIKNMAIFIYVFITLANPHVANIIGLFLLFICVLVFSKMKKLNMYFRAIYINPLLRKIFRKSQRTHPRRIPLALRELSAGSEFCIDCYDSRRHSRYWLVKKDELNFYWIRHMTKPIVVDYDEISFKSKSLYNVMSIENINFHIAKDYHDIIMLNS